MSEWLDGIAEQLKPAFGTRDQKVAVRRVAQEMDEEPSSANELRSYFRTWVDRMGWLNQIDERPLPHELPPLEFIARESAGQLSQRLDNRLQASERRVANAIAALAADWPGDEARSFVACESEWSKALNQSRSRLARGGMA